MCLPPATLMLPLVLTVSEWQQAQVAVTGAVRAWWPVGGIP